MNISKAIEILTRYGKDYTVRMEPDFDDALKLGIEALKRLQRNRGDFFQPSSDLLPGETTEEET